MYRAQENLSKHLSKFQRVWYMFTKSGLNYWEIGVKKCTISKSTILPDKVAFRLSLPVTTNSLKFCKSITRPLAIDFAKFYWIWTNIRLPWNDLIMTLLFLSCKNASHRLPIIIHTQTFRGGNSVQNHMNIHIKHFEDCLKIFLAPFLANIRLSAFFIRNIPSQT